MRVVVTGAAGYIGGQTVLQLLDQGHTVLGIDNSLEPNPLRDSGATWLTADFAGEVSLSNIKDFQPDAIVHCAGTSLVGPSMTNPRLYYDNNFVKTKRMLDFIVDQDLTQKIKVIFSSSASVYGDPVMIPCREEDPPMPMSPYGESKLMVEMLLRSYHSAYGVRFVAFRYFNACGADPQGRHGSAPGGTHIISRVLESIRDRKPFTLNGSNFPTPDGSCVRDYVHVADIAEAHIRAIDQTELQGIFNLGTSRGISNRQIIAAAELATKQQLEVIYGPERPGDPSQLTASADRFNLAAGWVPQYTLDDMIQHSWAWYNR